MANALHVGNLTGLRGFGYGSSHASFRRTETKDDVGLSLLTEMIILAAEPIVTLAEKFFLLGSAVVVGSERI